MTEAASLAQLDRIATFNFNPLDYIDSSWLEGIKGGKMIRRLQKTPRCHSLLNRYLISYFKLENQYDFDLTQGLRSVVLLESSALTNLIQYLGLIANRKVLRSMIRKQDREALKSCIGAETYDVVTQQTRHLKLDDFAISGFRIDLNDMDTFRNHILQTGLYCMGAAFASESRSVVMRMQLKLPVDWKELFAQGAQEYASASGQTRDVMFQIHQEVNREWLESLS